MDQDISITDLARVSGPKERRAAIAAIRAEYGLSETSAYAMLVRAAAGFPMTSLEHPEVPAQVHPLAS